VEVSWGDWRPSIARPAETSPTPTSTTLSIEAGTFGKPVAGTVSPSLTTIRIVLRGRHGRASLAASSRPAKRLVGPDLKAYSIGRSLRMLRTISISVVATTTGLASEYVARTVVR